MPTDDGKTLIVAEERPNGNVKIYDISNINSPNDPDIRCSRQRSIRRTFATSARALSAHSPHHVHMHGNLAFLPWYEAGLQVFNISNPASPVTGRRVRHVGWHFDDFNGNWGVDLRWVSSGCCSATASAA